MVWGRERARAHLDHQGCWGSCCCYCYYHFPSPQTGHEGEPRLGMEWQGLGNALLLWAFHTVSGMDDAISLFQ